MEEHGIINSNFKVSSVDRQLIFEDDWGNSIKIALNKSGIFIKVRGELHLDFENGLEIVSNQNVDLTTDKAHINLDSVDGTINFNCRQTKRVKNNVSSQEYLKQIQEEKQKQIEQLSHQPNIVNEKIKELEKKVLDLEHSLRYLEHLIDEED